MNLAELNLFDDFKAVLKIRLRLSRESAYDIRGDSVKGIVLTKDFDYFKIFAAVITAVHQLKHMIAAALD